MESLGQQVKDAVLDLGGIRHHEGLDQGGPVGTGVANTGSTSGCGTGREASVVVTPDGWVERGSSFSANRHHDIEHPMNRAR